VSNLLPTPSAEECVGHALASPVIEALPERKAEVGALTVHRVLPVRGRRLIGPWCFFDRYGPLSFSDGKPMDVAQHPHIGLQTVTWLLEGEVVHHDSLGSECLVTPGHLSLMTAGRGIVHTEETPRGNSGRLNGAQLWVALPGHARGMAPEYQCTHDLDATEYGGGIVTTFYGGKSPARSFSPVIGSDLRVHPGTLTLPLEPRFEHGILLASGDAAIDGVHLTPDTLYYLGTHRQELRVNSHAGARLLLIGGAPFGETILMWWNFVARTPDEIAQARHQWEARQLFEDVPHSTEPRLVAPPFTARPVGSSEPRP
jgi:redox-sensitive bicupin YhaK (pirin superfamily)